MRAPLSASARRPARYDAGICPRAHRRRRIGRIGADRRVEHDREIGDACARSDRRCPACSRAARCRCGSTVPACRAGRRDCCATPDCGSIRRYRCPCRRPRSSRRPPRPCRRSTRRDCDRDRRGSSSARSASRRVMMPAASSCMLVLPRMTAPASFSRCTRNASRAGWNDASAIEPARGRHLDRLVVVLDEDRNAVQRSARAPRRALGVERVGRLARARIDGDDRVQRRPLLVVGVDARQIEVDELPRRHLSRLHRALQLLDRLLRHVERPRPGSGGMPAPGRDTADVPAGPSDQRDGAIAADSLPHLDDDDFDRLLAAIHVAVLLAGRVDAQPVRLAASPTSSSSSSGPCRRRRRACRP